MNRAGFDRTVPEESETRRRPGACTHIDMAGDGAIDVYETFVMCSICGERWEENGARIHAVEKRRPESQPK